MSEIKEAIELPLLPLRGVVVYPHMVMPLFVGREISILALEQAMAGDKQILLVAQRNADVEEPGENEIYAVGTVSNVLQLLKLPDGTVKVLVEGSYRATLEGVNDDKGYFTASAVEQVDEEITEAEVTALVRTTKAQFDKYVNLSKKNSFGGAVIALRN